MKCVSALSTRDDPEAALDEATGKLVEALDGRPADLALAFVSPQHAEVLSRLAASHGSRPLARHVLGCTGESIVGEDREVERAPAVSLWALQAEGLRVTPRSLAPDPNDWAAWGDRLPDSTLILLADPFTTPGEDLIRRLEQLVPGLPVVGGMASGSRVPGGNRLLLDDRVRDDGVVSVEVAGPVRIRTVVSQGCRPIGQPAIVTRMEGNILRELGRRPAMDVLREMFESLDDDDRRRVQDGLHLGRVINEYQESFHRGDFLVRNILGADESGGIALGDLVRVGQTVQFHVRDASSADEDLRSLLHSPVARPLGALLFSCNGRGTRLFSSPNHDVGQLHESLGPVPTAGFFAMGEIGPIGGRNFIHGFTASIALIEPSAP